MVCVAFVRAIPAFRAERFVHYMLCTDHVIHIPQTISNGRAMRRRMCNFIQEHIVQMDCICCFHNLIKSIIDINKEVMNSSETMKCIVRYDYSEVRGVCRIKRTRPESTYNLCTRPVFSWRWWGDPVLQREYNFQTQISKICVSPQDLAEWHVAETTLSQKVQALLCLCKLVRECSARCPIRVKSNTWPWPNWPKKMSVRRSRLAHSFLKYAQKPRCYCSLCGIIDFKIGRKLSCNRNSCDMSFFVKCPGSQFIQLLNWASV